MDAFPDQVLKDSLKSLRVSGDYSDMTVVCGDDTYHVHKAVICPRSKYFETVLKAGMHESRTSHVDLSDHNPDAVKLVVDFFYQSDYQPSHKSPSWGFDMVKEPTKFEITNVTDTEPEAAPAEPGVNDLWASSSKKGKKKKAKAGASEDSPGPSNSYPGPEINLAESLLDKTFLLTHCRVYALAEYLQVGDLKALAAEKFRVE
ncbi:hypothetical protein ACKVWM_011663, partial [Pyricularia oryzae]